MKIKHIWSVLCKESVINKDDNNVSIHGVLEQLSVSLTPKDSTKKPDRLRVPLNCEVVSLWQKSDEIKSKAAEAEIEYVFLDPKRKELFKSTQMMKIPQTSRRFRSRMKIVGVPLTSSGDYAFQIKLKEKGTSRFQTISELPLEVKVEVEKPPNKTSLVN